MLNLTLRYGIFIFCFPLSLMPGAAFAASFDCTKAATTLEKTICNDPRLNAADTQMGDVYRQLRKTLTKPLANRLKQEQRDWLKTRTSYCQAHDADCMLPIYDARIAVLQSRLGSQPTAPAMATHPACFSEGLSEDSERQSKQMNLTRCSQANANRKVEADANQRSTMLDEGYISVTDVGELGDGRRVFEILENTGGTGRFSSLKLGRLEQRNGQLWLTQMETHHFGDRANGGLESVQIDANRRLWVDISITPADMPHYSYIAAEDMGIVNRQELSVVGAGYNLNDIADRAAAFFKDLYLPACAVCNAGSARLVYDENNQSFDFVELYWQWQPDANSSDIERCVADVMSYYGEGSDGGSRINRSELAEMARPLRICGS